MQCVSVPRRAAPLRPVSASDVPDVEAPGEAFEAAAEQVERIAGRHPRGARDRISGTLIKLNLIILS